MAKPFVKWAGGKGKLLDILEANLPHDMNTQQSITYIEPFVGGGAMLFNMLATHSNVRRAIINDINPALINCYNNIKDKPHQLIRELRRLDKAFYALECHEQRRNLYYAYRDEYNCIPVNARNTIRSAALFIFFNKTCCINCILWNKCCCGKCNCCEKCSKFCACFCSCFCCFGKASGV